MCTCVCVCVITPHLLLKDTGLRALHWAGHAYHGGDAPIHALLGQTNEGEKQGGGGGKILVKR